MKIISGGQTGVDVAGLISAKLLGLQTGGFAPFEYKTLVGNRSKFLKDYCNLRESEGQYRLRTLENVLMADATLIFARSFSSPGTKLTIKYCDENEKPCMLIDSLLGSTLLDATVTWLRDLPDLSILNIAGNSESSSPKIFVPSFEFIHKVLYKYVNSKEQDFDSFHDDVEKATSLNNIFKSDNNVNS